MNILLQILIGLTLIGIFVCVLLPFFFVGIMVIWGIICGIGIAIINIIEYIANLFRR